MKKYILLFFIGAFCARVNAQVADSVSMLPGNALDVYYNLETGSKDTVRNANWHLAFAVRKALPPLKTMQAATVRINDGRGVELYKAPPTATWSNLDTTNWSTWPQGFNSDTSWDVGAFNEDHDLSNPFDYGWGVYSMTSRDVTGSRMYIVSISSPIPGGPKIVKKIQIQKIVYDTMWVFTFANLNNTDSTTLTIRKSQFENKLFAYVNLTSKSVFNREPALNTWDLLFTRYKTMVTMFGQTIKYPVMGVLHNPDKKTAEYYAADAHTFIPDSSLNMNPSISEIGWDWKVITTTPGAWPIRDSLAYVIKAGQNKYYRLYFTGYFNDPSIQYITFNKEFFSILTGFESLNPVYSQFIGYPNPATDHINLKFSTNQYAEKVNITTTDISGKVLLENIFPMNGRDASLSMDIESLLPGIYFMTVDVNGNKQTLRFIKN